MFSFKSIVLIAAASFIGAESSAVPAVAAAPLIAPAAVGYAHAVPQNVPPFASQVSVVNRALAPLVAGPVAASYVAGPVAAAPYFAGPVASAPYLAGPGPVIAGPAPYAAATYASPYPYAAAPYAAPYAAPFPYSAPLLRSPYIAPALVR